MLARIRASLGRTAGRSAAEKLPFFTSQVSTNGNGRLDAEFELELEKVSGRMARVRSSEEVTAYLESLLPVDEDISVALSDGPLIDELRVAEWLQARHTPVVARPEEHAAMSSNEEYKRELLQCGIGITCADYALADTGTVVLLSGGEHHRLISLLPPVHVCLLPVERIVPSLPALLDHLSNESYSHHRPPHALTCITGPSRTADIEQQITTGVHGPKALHVLLYSN